MHPVFLFPNFIQYIRVIGRELFEYAIYLKARITQLFSILGYKEYKYTDMHYAHAVCILLILFTIPPAYDLCYCGKQNTYRR